MRAEALRLGRSVSADIERSTRVLKRLGELLSAGEVYAGVQRLHATSRRLISETARFDAVLMPIIAHPPLACGAMNPKGVDELIENLLDKLHLTRLLKVEALFGQLMDKSLWFTHWPAIQNVSGQPSIALPVHVTADGLPLGIQAAGRPGDEETLLSFAAQMERISGWLDRRAPLKMPS
jgi:amidase